MIKRKFTEQEIVRREKKQNLINSNNNPYEITKFNVNYKSSSFLNEFNKFNKEELEKFNNKNISMAGRIRNIRIAGKTLFINVQDQEGFFQIYIRKDIIGEIFFSDVLNYDLGDIIGVVGNPMKTKIGTLTLRINKINLLTKALKPLPDKYHSITNIEEKYRKKYLDLIMNPETKDIFIKRTKIINSIRTFLNNKGYLEFETPILQKVIGGAAAKPFKTHHNALNMDLNLRIATEISLKKLIVAGFEKVYEIGRIFRNEGISIKHNPEFTSIELYEAYKDMNYIMELTEDLFCYIVKQIYDTNEITYGKDKLSFSKPWKRVHMVDQIKLITGVDFWKQMTFEEAKTLAKKHKVEVKEHFFDVGHIINEFFETHVEKTLKGPIFVYGHPKIISPFAKVNKTDPRFTERFELFILSREYANAFSELNDPEDQYERFLQQLKEKEKGNDETNELDIDFITALEYGMPPTGGLGIGIDRLVMLLTNSTSIKDVLVEPQLKQK